MATTSEVNICRNRGDTTTFTVTITSDGVTPINITGFEYTFTVDPSPAPDNATANLFQLTSNPAAGITLTTPASGLLTIDIVGNEDQTPSTYFYDLQQTDGGSDIRTVLKGEYQIVQDITK